jgi:regulator of nonsense transcripts 3
MPPKVLQKNPDRGGAGVLPIPASVRAPPAPKPPAARLKLEIRRLPPGLTLLEFEEALGEEWKLGKGRVDWREYRQGKAKNVSKMPELSRCYVHLVKEDLVREFEAKFLGVTFRDKAGTWKNNASGGAPMLGFAMNQRVPLQQGKQRARADNRQGTIDQDAEYMAFLEAETQPIPKASAIDSANAEKKEEDGGKVKVKSTPLIEDLRERKANKAKAAASKAEKADRKGKGDSKGEESTPAATAGGKKGDKAKVEQAAKEVAKTANKQAAGKQGQNNSAANASANTNANNASQKAAQTPAKGRRGAAQQNAKATATAAAAATAQTPPAQQTTPAGPAAQRGPAQRQRGNNAEGIKKMLQKDLGIKPKAAAADPPAQTGTAAAARTPANNQQTSAQPKPPAQTPKQQQQQQASNSGPPKAYLKHANPSQGMTEILIQQALAQFGEMNNVTIDPRKGTAIAVFKTQEGLKKAVQAKKVPVAKGAVEVIEFKDRNGGGAGAGAGAGSGNNNNNNNNNNSTPNNNSSNSNDKNNNASGGGGRGGFRNRGGRAGRGGNNNSGAGNANAGKGSGQAAAAAG